MGIFFFFFFFFPYGTLHIGHNHSWSPWSEVCSFDCWAINWKKSSEPKLLIVELCPLICELGFQPKSNVNNVSAGKRGSNLSWAVTMRAMKLKWDNLSSYRDSFHHGDSLHFLFTGYGHGPCLTKIYYLAATIIENHCNGTDSY